jgi:nitroimidazol reductase NimA-like FMN-containing flavoprotein (pyridoxamine 5'-phosphate oxidase superfamily)
MRKKENEIDTPEELREIIEEADVCRIALCDDGAPYLVTMNFGFRAGGRPALFFHCAPEGKKLEIIDRNDRACFGFDIDHELVTADRPCAFGMRYRSIVGTGRIRRVAGEEEKQDALSCIMKHYSEDNTFSFDRDALAKTTVLRLDIEHMSGKRSP